MSSRQGLADRQRVSTTVGKKVEIYFQPIAQERHQGPAGASEEKKTSVTNELSAQSSALIREEDFAKQLCLARYQAGASLGRPLELEPALKVKTPKQGRGTRKAPTKGKAEPARRKAGEAELAKEGGALGRRFTRYHPPISGEAKTTGVRRSDKAI